MDLSVCTSCCPMQPRHCINLCGTNTATTYTPVAVLSPSGPATLTFIAHNCLVMRTKAATQAGEDLWELPFSTAWPQMKTLLLPEACSVAPTGRHGTINFSRRCHQRPATQEFLPELPDRSLFCSQMSLSKEEDSNLLAKNN